MAAAAALVIAAAGFAFGARNAVAEERGGFGMLMSVVRDYTTIDHAGAQITGGSAAGTITVTRSSGGAFDEGATHLATCVVYARISEAAADLQAACTISDTSGDSWFVLAKRDTGDIEEGGGGPGRWELVGGTGKYAGLSGTCTYETEYLPGGFSVSLADCTWQR